MPKLTIDTSEFKRVAVMVDNFSHDTNGNPNGSHTVFGYRSTGANIRNPSAELYAGKRRQQVGYDNNRDDYAPSAMRQAGLNPADWEFIRREGDRSEGALFLIYDRK
jgi:hypothetical protein